MQLDGSRAAYLRYSWGVALSPAREWGEVHESGEKGAKEVARSGMSPWNEQVWTVRATSLHSYFFHVKGELRVLQCSQVCAQ
jgi:hypothetical protein